MQRAHRMAAAVALVLAAIALIVRSGSAQVMPGAGYDLSGEWAPRFHEDPPERIPGPEIGDYTGLPINDAARLHADSWDASILTLPEHQCKPHPSDYSPRGPANLRLWREIDTASQQTVAWHTHISWQAPERTIYMDGRPHPPEYAAHTCQGFSTGQWEGEMLTVTTTHLKMDDPLADPAQRSAVALSTRSATANTSRGSSSTIRLPHRAVHPHDQLRLGSASADRAVPVPDRRGDRSPQGVVPSPAGRESVLAEFSAKFGVPADAMRGGAETTYPEYQRS